MKKIRIVSLLLIALLLLSGCGNSKKEEDSTATGPAIYYINAEETKLIPISYTISATTPTAQIEELIQAMTKDVDTADYQSALTDRVEIENYKLENNQLAITFNKAYSSLKPAREILLRAAVVRTLIQAKGVDCISFYIEDSPLLDAKGNLVGIMTADSFVENLGKQIYNIEAKRITLYFASADGTKLVAEEEKVYGSSNMSMEKLVMQHLLEGPENSELMATIPKGTKLISVSTLDGVCFVNLDSGFTKQNYEVAESVVIYSIVNSLTELSEVNKVQIAVNGNTSMIYRTDLSLETIFERDLDLIKEE